MPFCFWLALNRKEISNLQHNNPYSKAMIWRKVNPQAWSFMVSLAQEEAACGRKISVRWLIEQTRREGSLAAKLDNTCSSAFARMLIQEHPSLQKAISTRTSRLEHETLRQQNKAS